MSVNFHAGSEVASYPFDDSPDGRNIASTAPDDAFFKVGLELLCSMREGCTM